MKQSRGLDCYFKYPDWMDGSYSVVEKGNEGDLDNIFDLIRLSSYLEAGVLVLNRIV